jgi:hypothetical protein
MERKEDEIPELPEARPLPHEANPGGTEGVDPGWPGGSSELLGPEPHENSVYTTKDAGSAGRRDKVGPFACAYCERTFETQSETLAHQKTAHPRAST